MKRTLKVIFGAIFAAPILFFSAIYILEFRPAELEVLEVFAPRNIPETKSDTISILNWNIGYCGLGSEMDFFLDGGQLTRDSREATQQNLFAVIEALKEIDADIVLLQEVNRRSKRSYNIDQKEAITAELSDYYNFFAYNFKTFFIPIPLREPLGRAEAGLLTLSKFEPQNARRMQYPVSGSFPSRSLDLKRAATICEVEIDGQRVAIANTHNSAYDNGLARQNENAALENLLGGEPYASIKSLVGGDWNQIPFGYELAKNAASDPYYRPIEVGADYMAATHRWAADTSRPSMRYLDRPLMNDGSDKFAITDFFLVPKNAQVVSVETLDRGFENSDHQPVLLKIVF